MGHKNAHMPRNVERAFTIWGKRRTGQPAFECGESFVPGAVLKIQAANAFEAPKKAVKKEERTRLR